MSAESIGSTGGRAGTQAEQSRQSPWAKELDDIMRAVSGAFIFGVPLLFTMEMWWIGTYAELWRLLVFLAVALGVNIVLAFLAGFKEATTWGAALSQAVEAVAVGAVVSTITLLVLNRIAPGDPLDSILGKVVLQTIPLSIGASAANALLNRGTDDGSSGSGSQQGEGNDTAKGEESSRNRGSMLAEALRDLGATLAGGIFIGFSIAPTEEVPMLATQLEFGHKLALIAFTLVVTYLIVFESGFSPERSAEERGPFQQPITETALSYAVSLILAFVALYMFSQIDMTEPLSDIVTKVLVLGTPTAIGGAAGRALMGGNLGGSG